MIQLHPNVAGIAELLTDVHGWTNPVAELTIERIDQ